jgi:hypothetical protein
MNLSKQAAVAQLVHLIDEHHQKPRHGDPIYNYLQDEIWQY